MQSVISNYFPPFGYQKDWGISDLTERYIRKLNHPSTLQRIDAPQSVSDFINLDMEVSANGQLAPDEREGSKLLTETLNMYSGISNNKRGFTQEHRYIK